MPGDHLEILHDHYKETFDLIRERERSRDRLFLISIGLFLLLGVQILYPLNFSEAIGPFRSYGASVELRELPSYIFLSATWIFTLATVVRYCQDSINVERKYAYLHLLEDKISPIIGDDELYRREGRAYLSGFPLFSDWAWVFYIAVFPLIVLSTTVTLTYIEWNTLDYPIYTRILDTISALGIVISFVLYRILAVLSTVFVWVKSLLTASMLSGKTSQNPPRDSANE